MGRDGFEPSKQVAADLQSVPFGHSGMLYSSPLENKKTCCLHASMTHQLFLFSIVLNSYYFLKLKKTAYDRLPFRRRYFYYGV